MTSNNKKVWLKLIRIFLYLLISIIAFSPNSFAQQDKMDSLDKVLMQNDLADSIRIHTLNKLATFSGRNNKKRSYALYSQSVTLARRSKNLYGEIRALVGLANFQREDGNFSASKESLLQALQWAQKNQMPGFVTEAVNDFYKDYFVYPSGDYIKELEWALYYLKLGEKYKIQPLVADACTQTGIVFALLGDFSNAINYNKRGLKILEQNEYRHSLIRARALLFLGETYKLLGDYSQAIQQYQQSFELANQLNAVVFSIENESNLANVYEKQKRYDETFVIAFRTLAVYTYLKVDGGISYVSVILARAYLNTNRPDSAIVFGKATVQFAKKATDLDLLRSGYQVLSKAYAIKKDFKTAYVHNLIYLRYEDSLFNKTKALQAAYLQYSTELSLKESKIALLEKDKKIQAGQARQRQLLLYAMLAGVILVLAVMVVLVRSYQAKQRATTLLQQQKQEIQNTLTELKSTQAQLIQSEKMASLGELTAGIAHEIQNPLNFVNNFSEVNKELLVEMKDEMDRGSLEAAKTIANDVIENEEKINHHGKRADAIVKGMLQHSQTSTGKKEPTDINKLADEYLRLSYQGLRAKDKSFNAILKTDFDETIGKINIIPQDIGRVLLNLYNNAFYAVNEKRQNAAGYEPTVSVSTKKIGDKVEIKVTDNGNGIPQKAVDKIFQPFFTTKPTGQGTGLGLSLTYDIIKAHDGEIKVETKEGEGSEFIVQLPLKSSAIPMQ